MRLSSSLFGAFMSIVTLFYLCDFSSGPKFQINRFSMSPFIISGGQIRAKTYGGKTDLNIGFMVINTNRDRDMIYDNMAVSVFYKKELVMVGILPPFHHEAVEMKSVQETVDASLGYVNNWVVVSALTSLRALNFSLRIDGRIKFSPGTSSEKIRRVTVSCEHVKIEFPWNSPNGTISGQSVECRVQVGKAL